MRQRAKKRKDEESLYVGVAYGGLDSCSACRTRLTAFLGSGEAGVAALRYEGEAMFNRTKDGVDLWPEGVLITTDRLSKAGVGAGAGAAGAGAGGTARTPLIRTKPPRAAVGASKKDSEEHKAWAQTITRYRM